MIQTQGVGNWVGFTLSCLSPGTKLYPDKKRFLKEVMTMEHMMSSDRSAVHDMDGCVDGWMDGWNRNMCRNRNTKHRPAFETRNT